MSIVPTSTKNSTKPAEAPIPVTCMPKFMFGFNADVKGNLFYLDENTVIYPCGHNIVFFRTDDRSQRFIPGIEGSEGISAMALSRDKKFLAVCERSPKAICSVYNVGRFLETIKTEVKTKKHTSFDPKVIEKKKILFSNEYT